MAVTTMTCPSCDSPLRFRQGLPPGKRVKCPRCEEVVRVPDDEEEEAPRPAPKRKVGGPPARGGPAKARAPREDDSDGEEGRPARRPQGKPKTKKKPSSSSALPWIAGGGAG